jgi:hypothetical protein
VVDFWEGSHTDEYGDNIFIINTCLMVALVYKGDHIND